METCNTYFSLWIALGRRSYSANCWPASWHWHLWDANVLLWCNSQCQRGPHFVLHILVRSASCWHNALNDIIHRSLIKASMPATKKPMGLLIWREVRCLIWDVRVADIKTISYLQSNTISASNDDAVTSDSR